MQESEQTPNHSDNSEPDSDDAVVLFWRPGCSYCASLMFQLEKTNLLLLEVNIWEDPRAAESVRAITGGNETVPTVVVGDFAMVNPSATQVLQAVNDHAPHLMLADPS
ncbi:MAG: glutaredoxin domain-containing protein [Microthrixaceae bacterium]